MADDIHEVRIATDFMADGIAVWISLRASDGRRILHQGLDGNVSWDRVDQAGAVMEPTLRLSDGHGRALMEQLMRHYSGTPDQHTLRADFEHERARREKLEDHVLWALEQGVRPYRPPVSGGGGVGSVHVSNSGQ